MVGVFIIFSDGMSDPAFETIAISCRYALPDTD